MALLGRDPSYEDMWDCLPADVQLHLTIRSRTILREAVQGNSNALLTIRGAGQTPWEMWDALCKRYAHTGAISAARLIEEHEADNLTRDVDPEQWLQAYKYRFELLEDRKHVFPDGYKCINLIRRLKRAKHLPFSNFGANTYFASGTGPKPTFAQLCVTAEEQMQAYKFMPDDNVRKEAPQAMVAREERTFKGKCWNCGGNHRIGQCRKKCLRNVCANKPKRMHC